MPVFKYISVDQQGKEQKGVLEGDSASQVRQLLRSQGLMPIDVLASRGKAVKSKAGWFSFTKRISPSDLSLLTYQFSTLLGAGLPVEEALMNMAEQSEKQHVKTTLLGVHAKVLEGHSLADSFEEFPASFPTLYRSSVAAGEKSGQLSNVLNRLAEYMENQQQVQQKIHQALVYPGLLTLISFGIVGFLLTYVVPRIVTIFSTAGENLPTLTVILLDISHVTKTYGLYALILLIVGIFVFRQVLKQQNVRYGFHKFILNLPIIGKSLKDINTARFARTFGILFAASVPVLEAMKAANSIVKLLPMQKSIDVAIKQVGEGSPINRALEQTGYFSLLSVRLVAAGEMSGQLEKMLEKSASYQERMVAKKIDMGLAMFEPIMILLMGAVVLFIVLAILLPIFEINQLVG